MATSFVSSMISGATCKRTTHGAKPVGSSPVVVANIPYAPQTALSSDSEVHRDRWTELRSTWRIPAVDLADGPSDCACVLHHGHCRYATYYKEKLGFECLGTWQDPPVYAIVARNKQPKA